MTNEEKLNEYRTWEKFLAVDTYDNKEYRCAKEGEDNTVFVYAKGKKRYGWRFSQEDFLKRFSVHQKLTDEEETEKWHRRLRRVIKKLEASGLWKEQKGVFQNLLKMTLADKRAMNDILFDNDYSLSLEERLERRKEKLLPYMEKYPFAFSKYGDLDYGYVNESSNCLIKSMYFGYTNAKDKEQIKKALESKKEFTLTCQTGYDVRFSYNPEKNMAFYSEEYRGCLNGHYYIAIDHSTAVFVEND